MAKKKQRRPRQTWRFVYDDGSTKEFEIGKFTVLHMKTKQVLMHMDRLPDGKHLLIAAEEVLPDGRKIERIEIDRDIGES